MSDTRTTPTTKKGPASGGAHTGDMKNVKILMLHGYTQSGPMFRAKTRALEKMLQKSLAPFRLAPVLFYPTAPNRLRPSDMPGHAPSAEGMDSKEDDESDAWAWWRLDSTSGTYRLFNEGMMSLATVIQDAGGIDGVIGFSQGGAAAMLLTAALEQNPARQVPEPDTDWAWVHAVRAANNNRALRFAVIYSGFVAQQEKLQWLYEPNVSTPTLHYIGGLDTVVDESRSRALVERSTDPVVLVHPGGHFVPNNKEWVMPLVGFVKKHSEVAAANLDQ